ncbi:D-allose transporter substrate-binding protein [Tessaracoccus sp. Y36]
MNKTTKLLALAAAVTLGLTACGSNAETASSDSSGGDEKVAVVQKVLTSEFWQDVKAGAEAGAEESGLAIDIYAANSEEDVEGQVNLVENAIGKGYKAIGVAPISNVNLNAALANATKEGIYVVNVDEPVDLEDLEKRGGAVQGLITTDNVLVGNMAGDFIVEQVSEGEVAIIEGRAGVKSGNDRTTGAREAFDRGGLTVVDSQPADWDRTKAFNLAQNYLNKYPNLKAIYAANDTMAMGAQEAVANSGREVVVVGTDGNTDAIQSVADGGLAATVKQDSEGIGRESVKLMKKLLTEKPEIKPGNEMETVHVTPILVTGDNSSEYLK